jgi:hypothetical protein
VPDAHVEALLTHGYRLMALLGAVQTLLNRRAERLDEVEASRALQQALQACVGTLRLEALAGQDPTPVRLESSEDDWPEHRADVSLTPWLLRRLRLCEREAHWLASAVRQLRADLKADARA